MRTARVGAAGAEELVRRRRDQRASQAIATTSDAAEPEQGTGRFRRPDATRRIDLRRGQLVDAATTASPGRRVLERRLVGAVSWSDVSWQDVSWTRRLLERRLLERRRDLGRRRPTSPGRTRPRVTRTSTDGVHATQAACRPGARAIRRLNPDPLPPRAPRSPRRRRSDSASRRGRRPLAGRRPHPFGGSSKPYRDGGCHAANTMAVSAGPTGSHVRRTRDLRPRAGAETGDGQQVSAVPNEIYLPDARRGAAAALAEALLYFAARRGRAPRPRRCRSWRASTGTRRAGSTFVVLATSVAVAQFFVVRHAAEPVVPHDRRLPDPGGPRCSRRSSSR